MATIPMSILKVGGQEYEVVDSNARESIDNILGALNVDQDNNININKNIYFKNVNNKQPGINIDDSNIDIGWNYDNTEGAGLGLRSVDHTSYVGEFYLFARSDEGTCGLTGKPTGELLWGNQPVGVSEIGTYSGWTYRKWSDGRAEMWRIWTGSPTTGTHYWNSNGLYGYRIEGWPISGIISSTDYQVHAQWKIGSGFAWSAGVNRAAGNFTVYGIGTTGSVNSVTVDLYVTGKWK